MADTNYSVNYDDKRFTEVKTDEAADLKESNATYDKMISNSDKFYQDQINASKDWADKQTEIQNQQTDFAIEQIEQQKEQAHKDYTKEQSGAYVDWRKQSNQYGVDAEQKAAAGMANTGYSESSQVAMYNQYQNRVATARESYSRAVLNYDNAIKDARLKNNAALAQIAAEALEKQLAFALEGFQYKNTLIIEKANKATEIKNTYYQRYQDVLSQINHENALAEEVRQYNETLAENKRQFNASNALQKESLQLQKDQFAWQKAQAAKSSSGGSGSSSSGSPRVSNKSSSGNIVSRVMARRNAEVANKLNSGKTNTETEDTGSGLPPINMKSVREAFGIISEQALLKKIQNGEAKFVIKNGERHVVKTVPLPTSRFK